jgi:hypothetical protein
MNFINLRAMFGTRDLRLKTEKWKYEKKLRYAAAKSNLAREKRNELLITRSAGAEVIESYPSNSVTGRLRLLRGAERSDELRRKYAVGPDHYEPQDIAANNVGVKRVGEI